MGSSNSIKIQDTAFVTASMRATDEALSKDVYASLWETEQSKNWMQSYAKQVSHLEPLSHCLRNRFFYETLNELAAKNKIDAVLNLGCGFSMYPYVLKHNLLHIEVDQPDIIALKEEQTKVWVKTGDLPDREVCRFATDFNTNYEIELTQILKPLLQDKKVFILLEGVLYFISRKETERLLQFITNLQSPKDFLGSVSFQSIIKTEAAYNSMVEFSLKEGDTSQNFNHHTIDDAFYWNLPNYKIIERQDFYSSNKRFGNENIGFYNNNVINEHYYVLQRKP